HEPLPRSLLHGWTARFDEKEGKFAYSAETKVGGAGDGSGATMYSTVAAPGTVIAEIDGTEIGTGLTTESKGKGKEVEAKRVP
ncbi:hypothetical protein B9Z19DRAFT_1076462, partial [Tuber borchii]